ncbi:MAG: hypothetical protein E6G06_15145 [Actinobacteria bacterium]|nr:MAG: hypothetical protein E6G06_15145 [Actinomycetota bacterium]
MTTTSPESRLACAFTRAFVGVGRGEPLAPSRHVEDLVELVGLHPRHPANGCFEVVGPDAVPDAELCQTIVEIGIPPIGHVITAVVRVVNGPGPLARAARRDGYAPVDTHPVRAQFDWSPLALGDRVAPAVHEAVA